MNDQAKKKSEEVKLVTAPPRKLETKGSMSRPNPYTTDWTDMSDLTRSVRRRSPVDRER